MDHELVTNFHLLEPKIITIIFITFKRAGAKYIDLKLPVLLVKIVAKLLIWLKNAGSIIFTIPSLSI